MFGASKKRWFKISRQVIWSKVIVEEFVEKGGLTKLEEQVLRTRVAGWTRTEQCMKLGLSMATLDRVIKRLKVKYDHCQQYSALLPKRKSSAKELYMDTH